MVETASERQARFAQQRAIRAHYAAAAEAILADQAEWGIGAYAWKAQALGVVLTPIEEIMWEELRCANVIMYPQYPVDRYFVDFGNPAAKVAIECDGAEFHRDRAKDRDRQEVIEGLGWTVYRISGAALHRKDADVFDDDGAPDMIEGPARRLAREIGETHRICRHHSERKPHGAGLIGVLMQQRVDRLLQQNEEA